mgnify:CR=1 FL=1
MSRHFQFIYKNCIMNLKLFEILSVSEKTAVPTQEDFTEDKISDAMNMG